MNILSVLLSEKASRERPYYVLMSDSPADTRFDEYFTRWNRTTMYARSSHNIEGAHRFASFQDAYNFRRHAMRMSPDNGIARFDCIKEVSGDGVGR